MLTIGAFEDLQVWPIRIRLAGRSGYTLWASEGDEDLILALCGTMLLFKTKGGLKAFVEDEYPCNLTGLRGYRELRDIFREDGGDDAWNHLVPYHTYNFDQTTRALLGDGWDKWNLRTCETVLDCLNLMWDTAALVGDTEAIAHQKGDSQLHSLLDTLTFISRQELHLLAGFDTRRICEIYLGDLSRLARRALWVC